MRRRRPRRQIAEINVVPYIDVMLVLLVIFMVTAPLLFQGVKVNLPTATAKPVESQEEPLVISLDARGNYYLNIAAKPTVPIASAVLAEQVRHTLSQARAQLQRPVLIKGDKEVSYEKVMQLMVLLQQAGAHTIGLITQPEAQ